MSGAIAGHAALRFNQARIAGLTNTTANLVELVSPRTVLIVGKAKTRPNGVGGTLFTFRRSTAGRTTAFTTQQWSAQPHYVYSDGIGTNTTIPAPANGQSVEFEDSMWPAAIAVGGDTAAPWGSARRAARSCAGAGGCVAPVGRVLPNDPQPQRVFLHRLATSYPNDLHVTLLHALGIDQQKLYYEHHNRRELVTVTGGQIVPEIFG